MGKNKHSGGGNTMSGMFKRKNNRKTPEDPYDQRGDSDEEGEEDEEMQGIPRVLPIIPVSEYQIPSEFKRYRGAIDHIRTAPNPLIKQGKCYEYVYVYKMSPDGKTAWATMRPNYAGEYDPSTGQTYIDPVSRRVTTPLRFNVVENGIDYTNIVKAPADAYMYDVEHAWFREVHCKPIGIPSLKFLAYKELRPEEKELLGELDFPIPEPPNGGNAVKRNKRSGRKTRRKSRKNTRRKSIRNKL